MNSQIVLALLSDAGGVGKTTVAVNIAYEWATRGRAVGRVINLWKYYLDIYANMAIGQAAWLCSVPRHQIQIY